MSAEVHTDITRLLEILAATGNNYNIEKINKAFEYAALLHEGQHRQSGEAYISHPIAVAEIAATLGLDSDSLCAALLHDTVEDCSEKTNLKEIEKRFGEDVALIVDGLTKIMVMQVEDKEERHLETLPYICHRFLDLHSRKPGRPSPKLHHLRRSWYFQ